MTTQPTSSQPVVLISETDNSLLDLSFLWRAIIHSWILIGSSVLIFSIIAIILALLLPKQWEASTTLKIGRLPLEKDEYRLIEDPVQTIERIKLNQFKDIIVSNLDVPKTDKSYFKRTNLISKSLKGTVTPNTDFINLSIRALDQQDALKALQITVNEFQAAHIAISNPLRVSIEQELRATTESLASTSLELKSLKNKIEPSDIYKTTAGFSQTIVAIQLLTETEKNKQILRNQQILTQARLAALNEKATKQISAVTVSKMPVFPKKNFFLLIGALLGLIVGVLAAVLKYENLTRKNSDLIK